VCCVFMLCLIKMFKYCIQVVSILSMLVVVFTTVVKCTSWSRILAQDMVISGKGWYAREDVKTIKKCHMAVV
jgi:hypothetical protein